MKAGQQNLKRHESDPVYTWCPTSHARRVEKGKPRETQEWISAAIIPNMEVHASILN